MSSVNISDRIAALLKDKQLSAIELSKVIQVQRSTLSHILSGRNKPSIDLLERFHTAFEDLSLEWLITGKGKMYKA
ncbi:MAG: helix-turn-helix transcriptional regulator, partial [Bacteroidota bacterium]